MDALQATGLLDTPAEEAFDRYTRLCRRVLQAPVALFSLVDDQRQFFKSAFGLPEPWAQRRETPLSHSFCKHVVATGASLSIEDTTAHPYAEGNLAPAELKAGSYLGVPVSDPSGQILGALCVLDSVPRIWTDEQKEMLTDISRALMVELAARACRLDLQRAEEEYGALLRRFGELAAGMSDGYLVLDRDWMIQDVNRVTERAWKLSRQALVGSHLFAAVPAYATSHAHRALEEALADGKELHLDTICPVTGAPIQLNILPTTTGLSVFTRDLSERRHLEDTQAHLVREFRHRLKNLLAIVSAIATQTRPWENAATGMTAFTGRLRALAIAQDLPVDPKRREVSLERLVSNVTSPQIDAGSDRLEIDLGTLLVPGDVAQTMCLLIHELMTNAVCHGALSQEGGIIRLTGHRNPDGTLELVWEEMGGPLVKPPEREGFGLLMLQRAIRFQHQGTVRLDWQPYGLKVTMCLPPPQPSPIPAMI